MKISKILPLAAAGMLAAVIAVPTGRNGVHAGKAPEYAEGVTTSEIMLLDEGTNVEVEQETLTIHAEQFPYYNLKGYTGSVRSEYTLYNPTDTDETLHLAVPLGKTTRYNYITDDLNLPDGSYKPFPYTVTLNGENVESRLRHSYSRYYESTEPTVENMLGSSDFYTEDTPVYGYRYRVEFPADYDVDENWTLAVDLVYNPQRTRIFSFDMRNHYSENGYEKAVFSLNEYDIEQTFYVAGEKAEIVSARVESYDGKSVLENAVINTSAETDTTFGQYAGEKACYECVSDEDWIRAYGNYLDSTDGYEGYLGYSELDRWAEYEITVPAGGRVTHAVQTTLLPEMRDGTYYYRHDFSPAHAWAGFGTLSLKIYAASEPQNSTFTLTEENGAYVQTHTGYVMGKLTFLLGEWTEEETGCGRSDLQIAFLIIALVVLAIAVIILITVKVHSKRVNALKARNTERVQEYVLPSLPHEEEKADEKENEDKE